MRKQSRWVLATAVAIVCLAIGIVSTAGARDPNSTNAQQIVVKVTPKKLPKDKRVPITLDVNVFATNPTGTPNATSLALVDFDKDVLFQQKAYPTCDPTQFGSQSTTQDVKAACPDAITGSGTATVVLGSLTVHAQTIGANVAGHSVLLHSYTQEAGGVPLVGHFAKAKPDAGSKYGITLTTPVPPLAGGAGVLTQFELFTKKIAYKNKGKSLAIVSAKCSDKKLDFQARFTDEYGHLATGNTTVPCKQKKSKH
jgi:hypothetical protein